jgi:Phosphotransferase enzyme family
MTEARFSAIKSSLSDLLECKFKSLTRIGGGRNSQVYLLACDSPRRFALKMYFDADSDRPDRLEVEYASMVFMREHGIKCIPCPIGIDRELRFGVYEFIDGAAIGSAEVDESDVRQLADFLIALKNLRNHEGAQSLGNASEGCFSVRAIIENLGLRLERLKSLADDEPEYGQLHCFLNDELMSSFEEVKTWCQSRLVDVSIDLDHELSLEERTLSPSDVGFHNAIRCRNGRIVFLDFEYFGWDDPAKMISDFLFHPAKKLPKLHKKYFVQLILTRFHDVTKLAQRVPIVYPLFGLKWSLILLNEFIPRELDRRRFAGRTACDRGELLLQQLNKSRNMLQRVLYEYRNFPYH